MATGCSLYGQTVAGKEYRIHMVASVCLSWQFATVSRTDKGSAAARTLRRGCPKRITAALQSRYRTPPTAVLSSRLQSSLAQQCPAVTQRFVRPGPLEHDGGEGRNPPPTKRALCSYACAMQRPVLPGSTRRLCR
eukprot:2671704-Rhodomonas_salina.2